MREVMSVDSPGETVLPASPARPGGSDTVLVLAGRDGRVRFCNAVALQHFGIQPACLEDAPPLWEWFAEQEVQRLRFDAAAQPAGTSTRLDLIPRGGHRALHCQLQWYLKDFVLLAEGSTPLYGRGDLARGRAGQRDPGARWLESQRLALTHALALLQGRYAELERANARLLALAQTDALTGLCNRHHFEEMLDAEIGRARRSQSVLSVVMVDLDRFKAVNDQLGHEVGDAALAGAARALRASSRPYDVVARYGGEEFVLLLPDTELQAGVECAERLRRAVESASASSIAPLTASLGVAALAWNEDKKSLLRRADTALYRAKWRGRNRVECDRLVDSP